jgi:hypothetical protein
LLNCNAYKQSEATTKAASNPCRTVIQVSNGFPERVARSLRYLQIGQRGGSPIVPAILRHEPRRQADLPMKPWHNYRWCGRSRLFTSERDFARHAAMSSGYMLPSLILALTKCRNNVIRTSRNHKVTRSFPHLW